MYSTTALLKVVDVATARRIEVAADSAGLTYATMMEYAGRAVASRALSLLGDLDSPHVSVLVGPGNNGGDGLVAGRLIAQAGKATVSFYLMRERSEEDPNFKAVREMGLPVTLADHDRDHRVLQNMIASADMVIDALYGIGVSLPLRQDVVRILRSIQQILDGSADADRSDQLTMLSVPTDPIRRTRSVVLAVDCPSGLDCDTGIIDPHALTADETVTFIAAKPGLFEFPGAAAVGRLVISTIGVPSDLPELRECKSVVADQYCVRSMLPDRPANANKGTFGRVLVVAGSQAYVGAPGLAALGAYRSGAGLVQIATVREAINVLAAQMMEPVWLHVAEEGGSLSNQAIASVLAALDGCDSLLVGPGLGQAPSARQFLLDLLSHLSRDGLQRWSGKLIVDADALNLLSREEEWWDLLPARTVITPHPGELSRLARRPTADLLAARWQVAAELAARWQVTLVLKGAHTLIAGSDGSVTVIPFKSDALATAGTGDVLAGVIAGLLAQGLQSYEACVAGAFLHGLAGNIAAESQRSSRAVMASDVAAALGEAFARIGA